MKKSTYSRPSQSVSTVKKSHGIIVCAASIGRSAPRWSESPAGRASPRPTVPASPPRRALRRGRARPAPSRRAEEEERRADATNSPDRRLAQPPPVLAQVVFSHPAPLREGRSRFLLKLSPRHGARNHTFSTNSRIAHFHRKRGTRLTSEAQRKIRGDRKKAGVAGVGPSRCDLPRGSCWQRRGSGSPGRSRCRVRAV